VLQASEFQATERGIVAGRAPIVGPQQKSVDFDDDTLITKVTSAATVARPFDEVVNLMDPRGWADRSELWVDSYAVRLDEDGRVVFDVEGRPERDEEVNRRECWGRPWSGVLFERTEWDVNERTISKFDVLLNIQFNVQTCEAKVPLTLPLVFEFPKEATFNGGRVLRHDYSLNESRRGQLGYQILDGGGVDVDSGYAYAFECGDVTRVEVQKSVRYADWTPGRGDEGPLDPGQFLNYLAPGLVGVWIESLVREGLNAPL
jgi:hypothetical protein